MSLAKKLLSEEEQQLVVQSIEKAEKNTSGEIRVHIEDSLKEDVMDHAAYIFEQLKMHKTELRNGVLFYVSVQPHAFAVLGDVGINQKVAENFWDDIKDIVISNFKKGNYGTGLSKGIELTGVQLQTYFPYQLDDINELSNNISFGEEK